MAERKDSKGGCDVGFFYYDWALSRYRWMDGNCFSKVSGAKPAKKMVRSSSEVKVQVGCNRKLTVGSSHKRRQIKIFFGKGHVSIGEEIIVCKSSKRLGQRTHSTVSNQFANRLSSN